MKNKLIVDFLRGVGKDSDGRTIYDIWNYTNEQLETVHNYIQWLFPLLEPSEQVLGSPYIENEEDVKIMREDLDIQDNIIKSLLRMEEFYRDNDSWLQPNDHNHMRITRIIKSVGLLSSRENAKDFYKFIMDRISKFKPITEESLNFWKSAVEPQENNIKYIDFPENILVFNVGDKYCDQFIPPENRPIFLWYWNYYYSHITHKKNKPVPFKDQYLHLFIIRSETSPRIVAMQNQKTFADIERHYIGVTNGTNGSDPSILRSFDTLIPELVLDFGLEHCNIGTVVFPNKFKGKKIRLFDETHLPIKFKEISELIELLPGIKDCYFPE